MIKKHVNECSTAAPHPLFMFFIPSTVVVDINVHLGLNGLSSLEHRADALEGCRVLADGVRDGILCRDKKVRLSVFIRTIILLVEGR